MYDHSPSASTPVCKQLLHEVECDVFARVQFYLARPVDIQLRSQVRSQVDSCMYEVFR